MVFPGLNYLENLCFTMDHRMKALWRSGRVKRGLRRAYAEWLGEDLLDHRVEDLTEAERCELVYRRILLQRPDVVFCVQPFRMADVALRMSIWRLLEELLDRGVAVVILAVNLADSLSLADRLIRVRHGQPQEAFDRVRFSELPADAPWRSLVSGRSRSSTGGIAMTFLKMLESIRTPFWDQVAAAVTLLGEETFFMLVGLALVWCFDKRWGFRLLFVGLTGTVLNQLLKAVFLIPRPWVIDPEFTIVETARAGATGYSFPSGHTQSAACVLGMLALWVRDRVFTALCVLGILAVAFSRMYLGVHTPLDVGVSLLTGAATVAVMPRLFDRAEASAHGRRWLGAGLLGFALVLLLYVLLWPKRAGNVAEFDAHGVESAWTLFWHHAGPAGRLVCGPVPAAF